MKRLRFESIFLSRVEGRGFHVEGEGAMSRVEGNFFFNIFLTFFLGTTCLPSQEGRRFFTFKRIGMSTYYFNKTTTITTTTSHFLYGCPGAFLYYTPPPPPNPTTRRCSRVICFLNYSYLF